MTPDETNALDAEREAIKAEWARINAQVKQVVHVNGELTAILEGFKVVLPEKSHAQVWELVYRVANALKANRP